MVASCCSVVLNLINFLDLGSKRVARRPTPEDNVQYLFNDPSSAFKNNKTNPFVLIGLKIFNLYFAPFSFISIVSAISLSSPPRLYCDRFPHYNRKYLVIKSRL